MSGPARPVDDDPVAAAPELSPRGARALAVVAWLLGLAALLVAPVVLGPAGMVAGLVSHLKGDRVGFAGAIAAAVGTVVGTAVFLLLDR